MNSRKSFSSNPNIKYNKKSDNKLYKNSCELVNSTPKLPNIKKTSSMSCSTMNVKTCNNTTLTGSNTSITQKPIIRKLKNSKQSLADSSSLEKFKYRRTRLAQVDVNSGNYVEIVRLTSLLDEAYTKIKELSLENKSLMNNQRVQERAIKNTNDLVGDYPKMVEKLMEEIRVLKIQNKRNMEKLIVSERIYTNPNKRNIMQEVSDGNIDYKDKFSKLTDELEKQKLKISDLEKYKENVQKISSQYSKRTKLLKEKLIENKILLQKNQNLEKEIQKLKDEFDIYKKRMKVQNNSYVEKNKPLNGKQINGSIIHESRKKLDTIQAPVINKNKKIKKNSHHTKKLLDQEIIDDSKDDEIAQDSLINEKNIDVKIDDIKNESVEKNDIKNNDINEEKNEHKTDNKKNDKKEDLKKNIKDNKKEEIKEDRIIVNKEEKIKLKVENNRNRVNKNESISNLKKNEKCEKQIKNNKKDNSEINNLVNSENENCDIYSDDFEEIIENDQKFFVPSQEDTLKPSTFIKPNLYFSASCSPEPEVDTDNELNNRDIKKTENNINEVTKLVNDEKDLCIDLSIDELNNNFNEFGKENLDFFNDFTENKIEDINLKVNEVENINNNDNIFIDDIDKKNSNEVNTEIIKNEINKNNVESKDSLSLDEYQFSDDNI